MGRALVIINGQADREKVARWAMKAPLGARFDVKSSKRTLPQNDKMHAMLTEVAEQVPYHGVRLSMDDYKLIFLDALSRELRIVPNLDGDGFVNLGRHSSTLTVEEMSGMIELIYKFGAEHGVTFKADAETEDA